VANFTPWPLYPWERNPVPIQEELDGPCEWFKWFWGRENLFLVPGFITWNVQSVPSPYTNYSIPAPAFSHDQPHHWNEFPQEHG